MILRGGSLLVVVTVCLFSFKLILLPVGDSGIRLDDLLILLMLAWMAITGRLRGIKVSRAFRSYAVFLCAGVASALWNGFQGRVDLLYSLVFVARQAEYMSFFFFGYRLWASVGQLSKGVGLYALALAFVVPAQMLRYLPVPSRFDASRAIGNTNGPYELAVVAGFILCYLGYRQRSKTSGVLAFVLLVLTAARVTFVGVALSLARVALRRFGQNSVTTTAAISLVTILGIALFTLPDSPAHAVESPVYLAERLRDSASLWSLAKIPAMYELVPAYETSVDYETGAFVRAIRYAVDRHEADPGGVIRFYRWFALLKSTLAGVDSTLIGLGPSFGTTAVDGYFVRVFVETGITGVVLFGLFLKRLYGDTQPDSWPLREYIFILAITGCFIDIFVSYKPMLLLWLWHGLEQGTADYAIAANRLSHAGRCVR